MIGCRTSGATAAEVFEDQSVGDWLDIALVTCALAQVVLLSHILAEVQKR